MKNIQFLLFLLILIFQSCTSVEQDTSSNKSDMSSLSPQAKDGIVPTRRSAMIVSDNRVKEYMSLIEAKKHGRIDTEVAKNKLRAFKTWADIEDDGITNGSIDFTEASYGHWFKLEPLYNYLDSLKKLNNGQTDPKKIIDGIRIYNGASFFKDGFVPELFLYPTVNKKNMDDIDSDYPSFLKKFDSQEDILKRLSKLTEEYFDNSIKLVGNGAGYNTSLPCPQSCP